MLHGHVLSTENGRTCSTAVTTVADHSRGTTASIFSSPKRAPKTTKSIDDQTTFFASTNIISWTLYTVVCFFKKSDGDWLLASATHGVAKYLLWITQYRSFWRRTSSVCNLMYCVHGGLCVRYSTRCLCCTARQSQIFTFCWRHRGASFTT